MGNSAGRQRGSSRSSRGVDPYQAADMLLQREWQRHFKDAKVVPAIDTKRFLRVVADEIKMQITDKEIEDMVAASTEKGSNVNQDNLQVVFRSMAGQHFSAEGPAAVAASQKLITSDARNFLLDKSTYSPSCTSEVVDYVRSVIREQSNSSYLALMPREVLDMVMKFAETEAIMTTKLLLQTRWQEQTVITDIILFTRRAIVVGRSTSSDEGVLIAFETTTGREIWRSDSIPITNAVLCATASGYLVVGGKKLQAFWTQRFLLCTALLVLQPPKSSPEINISLGNAVVMAVASRGNFTVAVTKPLKLREWPKNLLWLSESGKEPLAVTLETECYYQEPANQLPRLTAPCGVHLFDTVLGYVAVVTTDKLLLVCFHTPPSVHLIQNSAITMSRCRDADPQVLGTLLYFVTLHTLFVYDLRGDLKNPIQSHILAPSTSLGGSSLRANSDGTLTAIGYGASVLRLLVLDKAGCVTFYKDIRHIHFAFSVYSNAWYVSEDTLLIGSQLGSIHWLSIGFAQPLREQTVLAIHGAVKTLVVNGNYLIVGGERQLACLTV